MFVLYQLYININMYLYDKVWTHDNFILVFNYFAPVIPCSQYLHSTRITFYQNSRQVYYFIYSPVSHTKKKNSILVFVEWNVFIGWSYGSLFTYRPAQRVPVNKTNTYERVADRCDISSWYTSHFTTVNIFPCIKGLSVRKEFLRWRRTHARRLRLISKHTTMYLCAVVPILRCQLTKFKILNNSPIIIKLKAIIICV